MNRKILTRNALSLSDFKSVSRALSVPLKPRKSKYSLTSSSICCIHDIIRPFKKNLKGGEKPHHSFLSFVIDPSIDR